MGQGSRLSGLELLKMIELIAVLTLVSVSLSGGALLNMMID
jgi:hypothetical protein